MKSSDELMKRDQKPEKCAFWQSFTRIKVVKNKMSIILKLQICQAHLFPSQFNANPPTEKTLMAIQTPDPTPLTLGSADWVEAVYASGPSRDPKGRSRPTQRYYGVPSVGDEQRIFEGRNEYIAFQILSVLSNSGIVKRFKEQPFVLTQAFHGVNAFPDFMFDLTDGRRYVLEVKSNRWIDEEERKQLEEVNAAFRNTSITYLLWTDKWPLHGAVFHATNHMRRAHLQNYPMEKLHSVSAAVNKEPKTVKELRISPFSFQFDEVLAATYSGIVHLNFFKPINDSTKLSCAPDLQLIETLFQTTVGNLSGWDSFASNK